MQIVQMTLSEPFQPPVDRLSALLERFRVRAHHFHAGPLCGTTTFAAEPGRAFLHVLRRGDTDVTHLAGSGLPRSIALSEPTILFYPRPLTHAFRDPPEERNDFVCATLDFDGGIKHPIVQALPPLVMLRIADVEGIGQTLDLLFAETERVRCGQRLLADRLFEVLLAQIMRWLLDHPAEAGIETGLIAGLAHPRLARLLTALHERPGEAWTLESMASTAGMSRSALASGFRSLVGATPADYLLRWRVAIAQSMLREGKPVGLISDNLGYASPAAFSRAFAQVAGHSPRAWLAEQRIAKGS